MSKETVATRLTRVKELGGPPAHREEEGLLKRLDLIGVHPQRIEYRILCSGLFQNSPPKSGRLGSGLNSDIVLVEAKEPN